MGADQGAMPDRGRLLVVCKTDEAVDVLDIASGRSIGVIRSSGTAPHEVAVGPDGRFAYVPVYSDAPVGMAGSDGRRVDILDMSSMERIGGIDLPYASRPHLAFVAPGGRLLISTEDDRSVTVIDLARRTVIDRLPTGQAESHMFALTPDGRRLVTANVGPGSVSIIDVPTRTLVDVIPVASSVNRICVDPRGRWAYTADQGEARLAVIDVERAALTGWIALPSIGFGAAVAPGGRLVVALRRACEIAIVDLGSGDTISRAATPSSPQAVVVHPDGRHAYSACHDDGVVVEVDIEGGHVTRILDTGRGADGIAWSPTPHGAIAP